MDDVAQSAEHHYLRQHLSGVGPPVEGYRLLIVGVAGSSPAVVPVVGADLPWFTQVCLVWQQCCDGNLSVDAEKPAPTLWRRSSTGRTPRRSAALDGRQRGSKMLGCAGSTPAVARGDVAQGQSAGKYPLTITLPGDGPAVEGYQEPSRMQVLQVRILPSPVGSAGRAGVGGLPG